jgi:hypothetical protein
MAMRASSSRALVSVLRSTRAAPTIRNSAIRSFTTTPNPQVIVSEDVPNMRHAQRDPDVTLRAPPVNPADKYAVKADEMHRYGSWLMGCLPKYIQQFSVWKDELVIYIAPSGVIPVMTFLKCAAMLPHIIFEDMLTVNRQYGSRVYTGIRHYSRRLSYPRSTLRSSLQPPLCPPQFSYSCENLH